AVIDFDESPRRSAWPARFKNFRSDVEKNNLEFLNLAPEEEGRPLPPLTKDEVMTPELDVQILSSHVRATLARREPLSKHEWREMMHCIYQRYLPYDHYIRQTRYWYLGMAQSIIDQFPFVFSHLNRRDAMGLVARRLKNKFKNSRRISTNKNERRHGLSGLDGSPGSSAARRNSGENATEASNDPNITSLEQQSDGSTGAKGSDVTTNKAPQIPDIDQVSDHGSEELSTADDVDVLDEAS
ncbi:uncharacterized protein LOC122364171, partial [Amphibalanus amphitrite]|uniref:uncharacterized protein LOC122364171 n=1 Tax=Amphibalanus amphitrite TaxID=1232801 RepID=UPI001C918534